MSSGTEVVDKRAVHSEDRAARRERERVKKETEVFIDYVLLRIKSISRASHCFLKALLPSWCRDPSLSFPLFHFPFMRTAVKARLFRIKSLLQTVRVVLTHHFIKLSLRISNDLATAAGADLLYKSRR